MYDTYKTMCLIPNFLSVLYVLVAIPVFFLTAVELAQFAVLYIYLIESSISTYWYGSTQVSTLKAIGHGRARSFRYTSKQPSIDHSATINLNPKLEGPNKECTKHPPTLGQSLGSFEIDSLELS